MSLYFRPEKAVLGDVIPYYDNGVFKPFYLRNYRANRDEQHQDSWVMLSTTIIFIIRSMIQKLWAARVL